MPVKINKMAAAITGRLVEREENCRVCNEKSGEQIAIVDYWDIKTSRLISCPVCNHIQLDPMLNDEETAKGCLAYYIEESLRTGTKEQIKNCIRNFRRGLVFGLSLKHKKISPLSVLELGPGSGYFSAGLQFVFPAAEISVMDVNTEVLKFNQEHHNYKIIQGIPDNFLPGHTAKFDLVIARDIIEHVSDISKVLSNINLYLGPNGYFHFLTPNGHEDVWKHYLTAVLANAPSELLINHVNYYDGKGLKDLLLQKGFKPVDYYTYNLKTTMRGAGWKKDRKLMSPVSRKSSADFFLKEKAIEVSNTELIKKTILDQWYIRSRAKWITYAYSLFQHFSLIRVNPGYNAGHEIYGLFKKT